VGDAGATGEPDNSEISGGARGVVHSATAQGYIATHDDFEAAAGFNGDSITAAEVEIPGDVQGDITADSNVPGTVIGAGDLIGATGHICILRGWQVGTAAGRRVGRVGKVRGVICPAGLDTGVAGVPRHVADRPAGNGAARAGQDRAVDICPPQADSAGVFGV